MTPIVVVPLVVFAVFVLFFGIALDDWFSGVLTGIVGALVALFFTGMVVGSIESGRVEDACRAACISADAPYAGARGGLCWCYRGAREQFAVGEVGE